MSASVTISMVIPVRNGADTLEKCLGSIRAQSLGNAEIIILDSMSTDGSREIAIKHNCTIIDIPSGTFNHGLTRNIGAIAASGSLIFFTVQDAYLPDERFLEKMSRHFEDQEVQGVVGHQAVPHELDKNPMQWYRPVSAPKVEIKQLNDPAAYDVMPVADQQNLIAWDNVVAMYRKEALLLQPFVETAFAEDWIWSFEALKKGWKLVRDASLVVYHYHHQTYEYAFNSSYTLHYHLYKFFGFVPTKPDLLMPVTRIIYHLLRNKDLGWREKFSWIRFNIRYKQAVHAAAVDFIQRLKQGTPAGIEEGYQKYCKIVPQGMQNKLMRA